MSQDFINFVAILKENPDFPNLRINGTILIYQGKTLDLSNFNLTDFFSNNQKFYNDLPSLSIKTIFDVLKIHIIAKSQKDDKKIEPDKMEQISNKFPILKDFHVISNVVDENKKTYVHYVDKNGISHIIPNITAESLIKDYHDLVISKNSIVTSEELFNYLNLQAKEIKLESLNGAKMHKTTSEEHINNLEMLNNRNHETGNTLDTALGNEEEHIYFNEQKVQTFDLNEDYQIVKNSHESRDTSEYIQEEQVVEAETINLITFEEYSTIILKENNLNSTKENQVETYESFLFDIITYKDYLTFELYQIYQKFLYLVNYLSQVETPTKIMNDAKERYETMFDRSEKVELTNSESKVSKLIRMQKDYKIAGYVSIYIYVIAIVVLIGILIGLYLLVSD